MTAKADPSHPNNPAYPQHPAHAQPPRRRRRLLGTVTAALAVAALLVPAAAASAATAPVAGSASVVAAVSSPAASTPSSTPSSSSPSTSSQPWVGASPNPYGGRDFFIDSATGSDANPGTSQQRPWKSLTKASATTFRPGDRILLKAGSRWDGQQLWPKGDGAAGKPITIGAYGAAGATRPYIATAGKVPTVFAADGTKDPQKVGLTGAVVLRNQQQWEIKDLELSNDDDPATDITTGNQVRDGVSISINADLLPAGANSIMKHFRVSNLYVHDVDGPNSWQKIYLAGVNFQVFGSKQYGDYPTGGDYFQDVRIEDNVFKTVELNAVQFGFNWFGDAQGQADESGKFHEGWEQLWVRTRDLYSRDVYIGHNYAEDIGQGAFQIGDSKNLTAEYNEVNGYLRRYNGVSCALYMWASADSTMQYNEVYGGPADQFDGTPWDLEFTNFNVTYQYNYSHDNHAGWMAYMGNSSNSVARYNLSVNDNGVLVKNMLSTNYSPTYFANNVFVYDASKLSAFHDEVFKDRVYLLNNIFYNTSTAKATTWYEKPGALDKAVFSNNDYFEASGAKAPTQPADAKALNLDPQFVQAPATYARGAGVDKIATSAARFALKPTSPLIDAGRYNAHLGTADFLGTPLYYGKAPDIGLAELAQGTKVDKPVDTDPIENTGVDTRTDLALKKPVTVSSQHPGANLAAANLTDGSTTTRWAAADDATLPLTIDVDFGAATTFYEVDLSEFTDAGTPPRIAGYTLQTFTAGAWKTLAQRSDGVGATKVVKDFGTATGSKLRLTITSLVPGATGTPTMSEIRVFAATPTTPAGKPTVTPATSTFDTSPATANDPANAVVLTVALNGDQLSGVRYIGPEGNVLSSLAAKDYAVTTKDGSSVITISPDFMRTLATGTSGLQLEFASGATLKTALRITASPTTGSPSTATLYQQINNGASIRANVGQPVQVVVQFGNRSGATLLGTTLKQTCTQTNTTAAGAVALALRADLSAAKGRDYPAGQNANLTLTGTPKAAGTATYRCALTASDATGAIATAPATFTVNVVN